MNGLRRPMSLIIIAGLVFLSALAVVYSKHQSRKLFSELEQLRDQQQTLDVEWGRLLLEQAAWANPGDVERVARRQLDMRVPGRDTVLLPRIESP